MAQQQTPAARATATINGKPIACDCPDAYAGALTMKDCFTCCRVFCSNVQHERCSVRDQTKDDLRDLSSCNRCRATEIELHEKLIENLNEQSAAYQQAVTELSEQTRRLFVCVLWRQYCLLPASDATEAVKEACAMRVDGSGKMVPEQAAPESWVEAVEAVLAEMAEVKGGRLAEIASRMGPPAKEMNTRILEPLREFARELIHQGPWKGQRQKLGVLGEALGLEPKGTVWKG